METVGNLQAKYTIKKIRQLWKTILERLNLKIVT